MLLLSYDNCATMDIWTRNGFIGFTSFRVSMPRPTLFLFLLFAMLTACSGNTPVTPVYMPSNTVMPLPFPSSTNTASLAPPPTFTPTFTASPSPTPTWVIQGPDAVIVPILIYHHIDVSPTNNPHFVSPEKFEEQLKLLRDWGYTSISTTLLVQAITEGALLPPRPILLTFDDANQDNYTNAFPLMQKYGFTGVLYLPFYYIGAPGCLTVEQIKEMVAAGWEVGSHSLTHPDLRQIVQSARMRAEIVESRRKLEELLGVPILTFAYPFGSVGNAAIDYVKSAGYIAGMGATGYTAHQWKSILYNLQRIEIRGNEDARTFTRFLPWHGDPSFLPTVTPTPNP